MAIVKHDMETHTTRVEENATEQNNPNTRTNTRHHQENKKKEMVKTVAYLGLRFAREGNFWIHLQRQRKKILVIRHACPTFRTRLLPSVCKGEQ